MGWTDFGWEDDPSRATPVDAEQLEAAGEHAYDKAVADAATAASAALTAHTGDTTAAHAGSAISFTPTGTIASTDVQAAVAEVASERVTADAALDVRVTSLESGQGGGGSGGSGGSGLPSNVRTVTTTATAVDGDFILANATSAGFTVTLPATGTVIIKKVDGSGNAVAIAPAGGGTVDGDTGGASITSPQFGAMLKSTAANTWKIVSPTAAGGSSGSGITASATRPASPDDGAVWLRLGANGMPTGELEVFAATAPAPDVAPDFTVDPVISGSGVVAATLTCDGGVATGRPTPTKTYQWKNAGVAINGATASTYVVQAGDIGDALTCTVTATNRPGTDSATSNTITGVASPTAPGQVTGLGATAGDAQVALTWTAPASNGGSAITDSLVEKSSDGGSTWATVSHSALGTATAYTVTGLTNDTTYKFRVSAVNAVGTGTASSTATATPVSAAQTPDSIFGSDMVSSWYAKNTTGSDGAAVASAPQTAGTVPMTQSTSGKRPLLKLAIVGGKPVWRLDGVDDVIAATLASSVASPFTIGVVFKERAPADGNKTVVDLNSNAQIYLGDEGDGTVSVNWLNNDYVIVGHSSAPAAFHMWTFTDDGTNGEVRIDGAVPTGGTSVHPSPQNVAYISVGATASGANFADLDVAEVWIAKRLPTSGDRTALATYRATEYGL